MFANIIYRLKGCLISGLSTYGHLPLFEEENWMQEEQGYAPGLITKIERQKNKKRYNLYLDGEYAFSVHEDVLVSLQLLKGKQMTVADLKQALALEEEKQVERALLYYLSFRPRTSLEVKRYLRQKGYREDLIEKQLGHAKEKGYLNDREFAKEWIKERMLNQKKGIYLLKEELKQKGISPELVDELASTVSPEEEWAACYQLALKRMERIKETDQRKLEYKLKQYLARRGFPLDLIQRVYRQLIQEKQT